MAQTKELGVTVDRKVADKIFKYADKDKNGILSAEEWERWLQISNDWGDNYSKQQSMETLWLQKINKKSIDIDYMHEKSIINADYVDERDEQKFMDALGDLNSDGEITMKEYIAYMKALRLRVSNRQSATSFLVSSNRILEIFYSVLLFSNCLNSLLSN